MSTDNETELQQLLADHCPALCERFKGEDPALIGELFQKVDESSYSLKDWSTALTVLSRWLNHNNLKLQQSDALNYVECAAQSESNPSYAHLPSLVEYFLEEYGCEYAVKLNEVTGKI